MFDFAVYLYEYACYTNINVQLKYPFFVGGSNDADIDFLASRGEATNGVLKEAILTLHSAVPAKMFRTLMRMCNMRAPRSSGSTPWQPCSAASIIMTSRKKRCQCNNICDVGFDFPSKLQRHFASSKLKLLEERYPALNTL